MFHQYGDRYFLSAVWQANSADGVTCVPTLEEKTILRSQNQQAVTPTQVAVNSESN
jgi:hypothetical protein